MSPVKTEADNRNPAAGGSCGPGPLRWSNWDFACITAVATVAVCMVVSFLLPDLLIHQWVTPPDGWMTVTGAQWVSHGAIGTVYQGDTMYLPLPGLLVLLAPVVALGDHLGLVTSYPFPLAHPSMWLLVGPAFFLLGATSILGVDYLADSLGVRLGRRRLIAVATGCIGVVPTCVWIGHPEDMVALAIVSLCVGFLLRQRHMAAALTLGVAILVQPWAALIIPVLVVASPAGGRLRALIWSSALPGACAAMLFALDPSDTYRSLIMQPMLGAGQHLPWWGLSTPMKLASGGFVFDARVGSYSRSLAVVAAIVAALWIRKRVSPSSILAASSVALLARGAFETQFWCYYVAPAAAFLLLAVAASAQTKRRWIVGGVCAFAVSGIAAGAYDGYSIPSLVAFGVLVCCGGAAITMSLGPGSHNDRLIEPDEFSAADEELALTLDSLDGADNYAQWIYTMVQPFLGERLLEVGAGHGTFTCLLRNAGRSVVATDLSRRCVERLQARFGGEPDVEVVHGDLTALRQSGQFDTAILINVLEHIENDVGALADLATLIAPSGRLILWAPASPALYSDFDRRVGHYRRYRIAELRSRLETAGFQAEELKYANALGALAWWVFARMFRRNPTRGGTVQMFDRCVLPVVRRLESWCCPPFGQSILAIAVRPALEGEPCVACP